MNEGNVTLIPKLFAPDYVHRSAGGEEIRGHDGWKRAVETVRAAFPDVRYAVEELVSEGDRVVCRHSMTGTHQGEYLEIAPTGTRITSGGLFINRFKGGKIKETWGASNMLWFFQRLGVTPPSG